MKKFNLHWKSGSVETITGNMIDEAFRNAGYSGGALSVLDYYEEAKEVPVQHKDIILVENHSQVKIGRGTMFAKQLMKQLENGLKLVVITIMFHEWICDVCITPFKITCNCIERKQCGEVVCKTAFTI